MTARYVVADTALAAEKVLAIVGERASFATAEAAQAFRENHPKPCRYRVWEMRDGRAVALAGLPKVNGFGAMGAI